MYRKIYIDVLVHLCLFQHFIYTGISMNAYEEIFAGFADPDASYPDADPDAT